MSPRGLQGHQLKSVPMSFQHLLLCYCLKQAISHHHLLFNSFCPNVQQSQCVGLLAVGVGLQSVAAHINQKQQIDKGPGRTGCWQIKHISIRFGVPILCQYYLQSLPFYRQKEWASFPCLTLQIVFQSPAIQIMWLAALLVCVKVFIISQPTPLSHTKRTAKKFQLLTDKIPIQGHLDSHKCQCLVENYLTLITR